MSPDSRSAILAGAVLPMDGRPPIPDGGVVWRGDRILAVGRRDEILRHFPRVLADDPAGILMPGLINSHAHLELTSLGGQVRRGGSFTDWLMFVVRLKKKLAPGDVLQNVRAGERMLISSGVTAVADTASFDASMTVDRRLRSIVYREITGVHKPVALPKASCAISPHAVYSLSDDNLARISSWWDRHPRAPASMHVAESTDEDRYMRHGTGPFREFYAKLGIPPRTSPGRRVIEHIAGFGLLRHGLLAVHVNGVTAAEAELLRRRNIPVAVCPGSMIYFGFSPQGVRRLILAKVPIVFGTDSMASNSRLNLFEELRLARRLWKLAPRVVIASATSIPGERLWQGKCGRLAPGCFADMLLVRRAAAEADPFVDLLSGQSERRIRLRILSGTVSS